METGLDRLREGQEGTVSQLRLQGAMLQRILDLGLTEGCRVACLLRSPGRGPLAICARGAVIALRQRDAACILIREESNAGLYGSTDRKS